MSDPTSTNKDLMRRIYEEMWNGAKPSLAAELFAKPEGVERFVSQFLGSFPDLQHRAEGMIAEGDQVEVAGTVEQPLALAQDRPVLLHEPDDLLDLARQRS